MTTIESEKLQKVLARAGLGSRRELENWIRSGRVQVNGQVAELGDRVRSTDQISVDGRAMTVLPPEAQTRRVLLYHKPEAEICSRRDPEGRPSVFERLPRLSKARWIAVGRLDFNTTGLLLFTTDGELAHALMHPSANIDREYLCRILGEVDEEMLARLRQGVMLEDGLARFSDITYTGGEGANQWYTVCVVEGRNRIVRRLWESQGVQVSRLKRVRYGSIFLPSRLKQGRFEELPAEQVVQLYQAAGLPVPELTTYQDKPRGTRRTAQPPQTRGQGRPARNAQSGTARERSSTDTGAPRRDKTLRLSTRRRGSDDADTTPTRRRTPRGLRRPRP